MKIVSPVFRWGPAQVASGNPQRAKERAVAHQRATCSRRDAIELIPLVPSKWRKAAQSDAKWRRPSDPLAKPVRIFTPQGIIQPRSNITHTRDCTNRGGDNFAKSGSIYATWNFVRPKRALVTTNFRLRTYLLRAAGSCRRVQGKLRCKHQIGFVFANIRWYRTHWRILVYLNT